MTLFSAAPVTTLRVVRPTLDDDVRRALRHAGVRRRRRASRIVARR